VKPRHMALGGALLAAAALVLFGDRAPSSDVAEAVERPAATPARQPAAALVPTAALRAPASTSSGTAAGAGKAQPVLALVPRELLIGDGDASFGQDQDGAAVFGRKDWTPPPPPPPAAVAPPPPPPPMAPPLPFTFIGKSVGEGAWEVYLARGDRTYVARANEVIDGTYRVDAIAPPVMTLTYLPLNQVQQLNIGVFE
jgi:hypothetical protein